MDIDVDYSKTPRRVIDTTNEYLCQWLDCVGALPPPVKRQHGGFRIERDDCDACARYEAPDVPGQVFGTTKDN